MKIITVTEPRFYTHWTTTLALQELAKDFGWDYTEYWIPPEQGIPFKLNEVKQEENDVVAVIHAAHLKIAKIKISELREKWPKAKIITLGSDTIPYTKGEGHHEHLLTDKENGFEFISPRDVDIHLDTMEFCVNYLKEKGVRAKQWYWNASRAGLRLADYMYQQYRHIPKQLDAICFANLNVQNDYRKRMLRHLHSKGLKVYFGGSREFTTLREEELKTIYLHYISSWVNIGTTSPSWTSDKTLKGWRDFFSANMSVPLVYDKHPEVVNAYKTCAIPLYDYDNFDTLAELIVNLRDNQNFRDEVCESQRQWVRENVLEEQFIRAFKEIGIL